MEQQAQAVGNGGWAGYSSATARWRAVERHAAVSTDTGHTGDGASFALGHPGEKLIDYAYRSEHEMTVTAKAIIERFLRRRSALSYFNGCSTGGRQALIEASRFPNDFDGIIAGAAANPKAHLDAWRIQMAQAMFTSQESAVPPAKQEVLYKAVVAACDAIDGATDGLIENPTQCHFDPGTLQCRAGDDPSCLTAAQVKTVRAIMAPPKNRQTGETIFPTYQPGTEWGWTRLLGGPNAYDTAVDQYKYVVFNDQLELAHVRSGRRTPRPGSRRTRRARGGEPRSHGLRAARRKLLTYHGFDNSIAPEASINFYKSAIVATKAAAPSPDWLRLFMVPGMGHCIGGPGPDSFDMVPALEAWVERGTPPQQVLAAKILDGRVTRTRPLCPFPQQARYKGTGSLDEAANFSCAAAPR